VYWAIDSLMCSEPREHKFFTILGFDMTSSYPGPVPHKMADLKNVAHAIAMLMLATSST
jgi:hypothetical protein